MKQKFRFTVIIVIVGILLSPDIVRAQIFTNVDINPGVDSSLPAYFTIFNNKVIFQANDGVHGIEPWVSDGTPAGTMMLFDIWPGSGSSNCMFFTVWNNKVYFTANDSVLGTEIWTTDGTPAGTSLTITIPQFINGHAAFTRYFTPFNNKLYFAAPADSTNLAELWGTDGTQAGTQLVKTGTPSLTGAYPGGECGFGIANGKLFFDASDSLSHDELGVSDGTDTGTYLITKIYSGTPGGPGPGYYGGFLPFNGKVYFSAVDSAHGRELWESDGTDSGTVLVKDIYPGPESSNCGFGYLDRLCPYFEVIGHFVVYNNKFYFSANDSIHGVELWSSDGTTAGTNMVLDINPGPASSNAGVETTPVIYNNQLYFTATDSTGVVQIWATNGTPGGTKKITSIYPVNTFSNMTVVDSLLYFVAQDSLLGAELFVTNGANTGTNLLLPAVATHPDPLGYVNNIIYSVLYPFNSVLAFAASYDSTGLEPWFFTPAPVTAIRNAGILPNLQLYPNPFSNVIMIGGLQNEVEYHITLTDMEGRIMQQQRLTCNSGTGQLDITPAAAGIYLLRITNGENVVTLKAVKQ